MTASNERHGDNNDVLFSQDGGIGHIRFNRPQARNALTFEMYEDLAAACETATRENRLSALIISGEGGKAFAAGTDISNFRGLESAQDALDYEERIDRVLSVVEGCPMPTIAAISGACTGGGAAIACACDLRIATADLKFGFPIARTLGNCLSIASLSRLSTLIGSGRTREIIFTSRLVGAEEALAAGLISEICPNQEALMARARELAETMSNFAPLTLRATKEALRRLRIEGPDADDHDLVSLCYTSADFKEGLEAFLAKRKPNWQGR